MKTDKKKWYSIDWHFDRDYHVYHHTSLMWMFFMLYAFIMPDHVGHKIGQAMKAAHEVYPW